MKIDGLTRRIVGTIRRHDMIRSGDRVAIAISGGSDSVALALTLRVVADASPLNFEIAGLVHLNHGLRGDEAARDEAFCRALAARLGWPIEVGHVDAGAAARAAGRSIEATARDLRDEFFRDAASTLNGTSLATGHTLDDQAETVLLRLLRGTSSRGLTGIRPKRGRLIRPLLECRRRELRDWLAAAGEPFCEDSSNRDESIARNRVRHQLMPRIEQMAPGGVRALARAASLAADDERYLAQAAAEAAAHIVTTRGQRVSIDAKAISAVPPALARRLVRQAIEDVAPRAAVTSRHLDAVLALAAADKAHGRLDLPKLRVTHAGGRITIEAADGRAAVSIERGGPTAQPLPVPGTVDLAQSGWRVVASTEHAPPAALASGRGDVATVQVDPAQLPLAVRTWRPGDRFKPLGASGRRKVQDLFVDRKVTRADRHRTPIVVDARGQIVWVAGLAIAHECRVTSPEAGMVILKLKTVEAE